MTCPDCDDLDHQLRNAQTANNAYKYLLKKQLAQIAELEAIVSDLSARLTDAVKRAEAAERDVDTAYEMLDSARSANPWLQMAQEEAAINEGLKRELEETRKRAEAAEAE